MSDSARPTNGGAATPEARTVTAEAAADCPFSIAHEYASEYFHRAEAGSEESEIRVPIRFLPVLFRHRVGLSFASHSDDADVGRAHDEIRIRWNAGTRFLPDFHGAVRFRIAGLGTHVTVEGSYLVPFGKLGQLFDGLIGSVVARASVQDLCTRVASYLDARNGEWQARVDAH